MVLFGFIKPFKKIKRLYQNPITVEKKYIISIAIIIALRICVVRYIYFLTYLERFWCKWSRNKNQLSTAAMLKATNCECMPSPKLVDKNFPYVHVRHGLIIKRYKEYFLL